MSRVRLEVGNEPFPGVTLVQLRGRGGFAEVWEAVDKAGVGIALKFMESRNTTTSSRELRIVHAVQKLQHVNLLRLDRVWSIPDYIVVAMELADGSLLDMLDACITEYHAPLASDMLIAYVKQAAAGLDYLNGRRHSFDSKIVGFQHCDVKPSNLLLVGDVVKLADFGFCTPTLFAQTPFERAGTPDFAAPEVHRGQLTDLSDQYSLAVTYYHLRTGRFPFPVAAGTFRREYSYARPSPDLSLVPRAERRVVERALDLEPTRRWPSCTAFATSLAKALADPDAAEHFKPVAAPVTQ